MVRPLRRIKQHLTNEECIQLLKQEVRGVLSVLGDNDYPYGIPIDFYYDEIKKFANFVTVLELTPQHICGKKVNES